LLVAVSLGLCLLAGHLQFRRLRLADHRPVRAGAHRLPLGHPPPRPSPRLLLCAALGVGIGLPQVLPSWNWAATLRAARRKSPPRAGSSSRNAPCGPIELLTFVSPEALGDPVDRQLPGHQLHEHCAYAGVLALLLAGRGRALRRDRWAALYGIWRRRGRLRGHGRLPLAKLLYLRRPPSSARPAGFARILGVYTLCLARPGGNGPRRPPRRVGAPQAGGCASRLRARRAGGGGLGRRCRRAFPLGWRFLPLASPAEVYPDTALTRLLQEKGKDPNYRVLCITPRENWSLVHVPEALLPPNAATVVRWYSPDGYDSLYFEDVPRLGRAGGGRGCGRRWTNGNMMLLKQASMKAIPPLRRSSGRPRWSRWTRPAGGSAPQTEGVDVYENLELGYSLVGSDDSGPFPCRSATLNTIQGLAGS